MMRVNAAPDAEIDRGAVDEAVVAAVVDFEIKVRIRLRDDALIGDHRAGVDVDSDKTSPNSRTEREGRARIIAQNIESNGQSSSFPHGTVRYSHGRNSFGPDP